MCMCGVCGLTVHTCVHMCAYMLLCVCALMIHYNSLRKDMGVVDLIGFSTHVYTHACVHTHRCAHTHTLCLHMGLQER